MFWHRKFVRLTKCYWTCCRILTYLLLVSRFLSIRGLQSKHLYLERVLLSLLRLIVNWLAKTWDNIKKFILLMENVTNSDSVLPSAKAAVFNAQHRTSASKYNPHFWLFIREEIHRSFWQSRFADNICTFTMTCILYWRQLRNHTFFYHCWIPNFGFLWS